MFTSFTKRAAAAALVLTAAISGTAPAEPVLVGTLSAKVVPEQVATLNMEKGLVSDLADASARLESGSIIAILDKEATEQEREQLELQIATERMTLRDELLKLQERRKQVEFYLNLSPGERKYATDMHQEGAPPTKDSLRDIKEREELLKKRIDSTPRLKRAEFERRVARKTLRMPFTGRLQYHFTLPEDIKTPFEYAGVGGHAFATVCDDSAYYITLNISKAELTQLPQENFSARINLPQGKSLSGTYSHHRVEQGGQGDMLVYFFRIAPEEHATAHSLLGSHARAELVYNTDKPVLRVRKMELITHPQAASCENWEQLCCLAHPKHHVLLIGETDIILTPVEE